MENGKNTESLNREMDLDFIREMGGIPNNEESLHEKNFLTKEKADACFGISSKIFLGSYMKEYQDRGKK